MTKLKSIYIKGFKEANREIRLNFSEEAVTVIYGENGSGKTTLLKVLHAVFNLNLQYLKELNIQEIKLCYENIENKENNIHINTKNDNSEWSLEGDVLGITATTSILFGVNRGLIQDSSNLGLTDADANRLLKILSQVEPSPANVNELYYLMQQLKNKYIQKNIIHDKWNKEKHVSVEVISIEEIENAIIKQYRAGQKAISDKVKNAFFNTISSAVDIELEDKNYALPSNFNERIDSKRTTLLPLIESLDKSSLQLTLVNFLEGATKMPESRIFRALLVNILEKVEEENIELKSISSLIEVFNNHLYRNKKMIVTENEAYILFPSGEKHPLDALSSGERHLLTFLTLFLIIGRNRDFFIIDEPEISLNMKWQRELMPLLHEINPNSQIIVATHSPSIAHKNSNYLVELV